MKRDYVGYGPRPPHPRWPGDARIALNFVLNYEEGGENNLLHGEPHEPPVGVIERHRAVGIFSPGRRPRAAVGTGIRVGLRVVDEILQGLDLRIASLPEIQLERVFGLADRQSGPEAAEIESTGRE